MPRCSGWRRAHALLCYRKRVRCALRPRRAVGVGHTGKFTIVGFFSVKKLFFVKRLMFRIRYLRQPRHVATQHEWLQRSSTPHHPVWRADIGFVPPCCARARALQAMRPLVRALPHLHARARARAIVQLRVRARAYLGSLVMRYFLREPSMSSVYVSPLNLDSSVYSGTYY